MSNDTKPPVVAGVLTKYANLAKGWRPRLFILDDGQLFYFKINGRTRGDVNRILQSYSDSSREVRIIGAETALLQIDGSRSGSGSGQGSVPSPSGQYPIQGMKVRESSLESHKFYVSAGGMTLHLKCETPRSRPPAPAASCLSCGPTASTPCRDDRSAWIAALSQAKQQHAGGSAFPYAAESAADRSTAGRSSSINNAPSSFSFAATKDLVAQLRALGVAGQATALVENTMNDVLASHKAELSRLSMQLSATRRQVQEVSEDKRVLETKFIAETSLNQLSQKVRTRSPAPSQDSVETSEDKDDAAEPDFPSDDEAGFMYRDEDGDEFFDAQEHNGERRSKRNGVRLTQEDIQRRAVPGQDSIIQPPASVDTRMEKSVEPTWLSALGPPVPRRDRLPPPKEQEKTVSLWSIIKECVGKDLTRICLPVFFNEPLSALQKMAEELEYSHLLDIAAKCPPGSPKRMMYVGLFAVSGYAATNGRTCKPFNPLLGETFEYVSPEQGVRFLAEKVVHHPTVLAAMAEGRGWTLEADMEGKSKFWGRLIELKPVGHLQITFHDGEVMTWNKVTTTINNLIVGKVYIDHGGVMRLTSSATRLELKIKFKDGGLFVASKHHVSGAITDGKTESPEYTLQGTWDGSVDATLGGGETATWVAHPPPPEPTRYNLTRFAIQLNEITPGLEKVLAPTDCRLRPDQSFLEQGRYTEANMEKQRLEVKQRAARKAAEEGEPIVSRWFKPVPGARRGESLAYKYTGGYWESREKGQYTDCRDIFGN